MLHRKRIEFESGLTLSVQASRLFYCSPRQDSGPWSEVECGHPMMGGENYFLGNSWEKYREPGSKMFAYVPIAMVRDLCKEHGPVVSGDIPENTLDW